MKVLFLQPPLGSWVYWGNHKPINVSHAQMTACVREWVPGADVKVLDCRALSLDAQQMVTSIQAINPDVIYMGDWTVRDEDHGFRARRRADRARAV